MNTTRAGVNMPKEIQMLTLCFSSLKNLLRIKPGFVVSFGKYNTSMAGA